MPRNGTVQTHPLPHQKDGDPYAKLIDELNDDYRKRLFQQTGCLLTTGGSEDHLVQPEGLPNYQVPPTLLLQPTSAGPEPNISTENDNDGDNDDDDVAGVDSGDEFDDMIVEDGDNDGNIFDIFD